jgi:predicted Zn-dependent protease
MALFSKEESELLLKKIIAFSEADECEVYLSGTEGGNIRYARNAISTSGDTNTLTVTVSSNFGRKTGSATLNEFDDDSLQKLVRRSEEIARLAPDNPEYMPVLGPQVYKEPVAYNEVTAKMGPDLRAEAVAKSIVAAREARLEAAGFLENTTTFSALMNSRGLFAYHKETGVSFSITTRNESGTGSGYAARGFNDISKLDTYSLTQIATGKANGSVNAKAIEPGKYTVILEPVAAAYMLESMFRGFDARAADEGRSFMSRKGGGNRLGDQLLDEQVTIYSDPFNPELPSSTWSRDGFPLERMNWIEKGKVKNLSYSQFWAKKQDQRPVPPPANIIMEGGTASVDDLVRSTEKGILVSRLWYIRMVDPQTLLLTGLTRDGTFYIENGKIKFPIKNLRFNESPVIMLNNLEALGKVERTISVESFRSYVVPPMKIRDFTFTSLSDAI